MQSTNFQKFRRRIEYHTSNLRLTCREILEKTNQLDPRISVLDDEFDEAILELEAGEAAAQAAALQRQHQQEPAGAAVGASGEGAAARVERQRRWAANL